MAQTNYTPLTPAGYQSISATSSTAVGLTISAASAASATLSESDPYKDCDVPGVVRCPDPKAFLGAVKWCVENRDEVRALAAEARDYVLENRTVETNIGRWREAVTP